MGPFQIPAAITKGKFQGMVCLAALSCSNCFLPCHTDLEHFFFPLFPQRNKLTGDGYAFGTFSKSFGKIKFTVQKIKKPCLIWCNIFISFSIFPTTKFLFIYNPEHFSHLIYLTPVNPWLQYQLVTEIFPTKVSFFLERKFWLLLEHKVSLIILCG